MNKVLVTAKVNPDLDGTACSLAYADLLRKQGKEAEGIVFGSPQSEAQYFIRHHHIKVPLVDANFASTWKEYILVDASSMKGMPKAVDPNLVVEVIDHRKSEPEKEFPRAKVQIDLIGAAATLIVERFVNRGQKPQADHAKLLYGAIFHNTLNFTSFNTSDRDRSAANYLAREFNLTPQLAYEMFEFATKEILTDVKTAIKQDAKEFGTGHSIAAYQLIVGGPEILEQKENIEKGVRELFASSGSSWAFINVVDLKNKKSSLFVTDLKGQEILEKVFNTKFSGGWATLSSVWLRKQIMPKVEEIIQNRTK